MPKEAKVLKPLAVSRIKEKGFYAVGGVKGLYLQVSETGAKSWILRVVIGNKRRQIGLGGYPTVSLKDAREKARVAHEAVEQGVDPIEAKRQAAAALRAEQARKLTFGEAVTNYLAAKVTEHEFKNAKHRQQWENTLRTYACPAIGDMPVDEITMGDIEKLLTKDGFWTTKTETATRVRQRIAKVLDWCKAGGHRSGDNPAAWQGNLEVRLPSPAKIIKNTKRHQPALPVDQLQDFLADLRSVDSITARCTEFAILTAARSGEVRHACWSEIDLQAGAWTIPASRMKAGVEHKVPLSDSALNLLRQLPRETSALLFPGNQQKPLSENTPRLLLQRMHAKKFKEDGKGYIDTKSKKKDPITLHGFRSTFRDWAGERTSYPIRIIEMSLAHQLEDKAEAAYSRSDLLEKRRQLMQAWADYCNQTPNENAKDNVTSIRA